MCKIVNTIIMNKMMNNKKHGKFTMIIDEYYQTLSIGDKHCKENIIALVYRTHCALLKFKLSKTTMNMYRANGFNKILHHFYNMGVKNYDYDLLASMVKQALIDFQNKKICSTTAYDLRRAVEMVKQFHETGKLEWRVLSPIDKKRPVGEFAVAAQSFLEYQNQHDFLVKDSIKNIYNSSCKFLCWVYDRGYSNFTNIDLPTFSTLVTDYLKNYSRSGVRSILNRLRKFFASLAEEDCVFNLKLNYSFSIPRMLSEHKFVRKGFNVAQIESILKAIPHNTIIGKRDYAMLLLGAMTGLRACDVVSLKLEDIDWHSNEIRVIQNKTGSPVSAPLNPEVGNAIADYILCGRPKSKLSYVFCPLQGVDRKLDSDVPGNRLRHYINEATILTENQNAGFHNFRRALGQRLLISNVSLELIAQVLGHRNISSTKPYLSADNEGLKSCGIPLEVVQNGGSI